MGSKRAERAPRRQTGLRATYSALDDSRWLRPALLVLCASAVGAALAPAWVGKNYPTEPELVGTPARADIKADYDDGRDIVDPEATELSRQQAVAAVPPVFDYDASAATRLSERVVRSFATAAAAIELGAPSSPAHSEGEASAERVDTVDEAALEEALSVFAGDLGIEVDAATARWLSRERFGPDLGRVLAKLVEVAQERPVVADRDRLQKVPVVSLRRLGNGGKPAADVVASTNLVDLDALRSDMGRILMTVPGAGELGPAQTRRVLALGRALLRANCAFNLRDTEKAKSGVTVPPVTITVKKGEMIIRDGEVFTPRHLLILSAMSRYDSAESGSFVAFGGALLVFVLLISALVFSPRMRRRLNANARDSMALALLFLGGVGSTAGLLSFAGTLHQDYPLVAESAFVYAIPIATGAMMVRIILRLQAAVIFAVVTSVCLGVLGQQHTLYTVYVMAGSLAGATAVGSLSSRGDVVRAGLRVGVIQAAAAIAIGLFEDQSNVAIYLQMAGGALFGGLWAGSMALVLTPMLEATFGYSSDLKLLELANLNHPALKELIVQAPGTYHHSIIVGSLVEAAAEAIGANSLLARVMAYYHDLGKGCNALYFIENQRGGQNPHDKLRPSMSAMIIRRHVTDGLEIAKKYNLGEQILAGIAEHHGTTLIQYFYHRATERAEPDDVVREEDYRYPGRKPQSREAALVMLGDSVEAASRSLPDPTTARLQGLVNKIINTKFTDGQLEECDITLKDLHKIAKAFIGVLDSIYHQRVEYPDRDHGDSHPKLATTPESVDDVAAEDRPDNIRRLGL